MLAVEGRLTPAGQTIWQKGIPPEIKLELPAEASPILPEEDDGDCIEQYRNLTSRP